VLAVAVVLTKETRMSKRLEAAVDNQEELTAILQQVAAVSTTQVMAAEAAVVAVATMAV
jgi:DNA-binding FrmR family transcriptional regulator